MAKSIAEELAEHLRQHRERRLGPVRPLQAPLTPWEDEPQAEPQAGAQQPPEDPEPSV